MRINIKLSHYSSIFNFIVFSQWPKFPSYYLESVLKRMSQFIRGIHIDSPSTVQFNSQRKEDLFWLQRSSQFRCSVVDECTVVDRTTMEPYKGRSQFTQQQPRTAIRLAVIQR
jgi:hypothetical protein